MRRDPAEVVAVSEALVRAAGALPTAKLGVAALALALGRACGAAGVDLDAAVLLARVARREADPAAPFAAWRWPTPAPDEELLS